MNKIKNNNDNNWYIHHFDDYHQIEPCFKGQKVIELGCYPTKSYSYNRYFGIFYHGRKPKLELVLSKIEKMIDFKEFKINHYECENFRQVIKNNYINA